MTQYENFADELDDLESLLDEGPEVGGSVVFLGELQAKAAAVNNTAALLTVADIDEEFTEDGSENDGEI